MMKFGKHESLKNFWAVMPLRVRVPFLAHEYVATWHN